ncbi:MAG: IS21 family transposase [Chitinophagales bacterium]
MSRIRHILRLYAQGRSKLQIASQTGVARNTLKKYIAEFDRHHLSIEQINALSDKDLEDLFIRQEEKPVSDKVRLLVELFPKYNKEIKRKGVTRKLLWEEYKNQYPDGFELSQFKHYFTQWQAQMNPVMHIEHKAGDKLFVDFAGDKLKIIDRESGEIKEVEVFIAILGASQLTYVEAVMTQQKDDFIAACERALIYYGGVPAAIVPDNLKSAVTKSSKYEPTLNESFADFAEHYSTTILPARAYKPRDKALVENAVRIVYTRIYAKLRSQHYFSLDELNRAIILALEVHNDAPLKGRNYSRRQQFIEIEKNVLSPLPPLRYELKRQYLATVMKNGHVALGPDKHYYSVPYRYIGKKVKLLYSVHSVEIFYNYERIALHTRIKSPFSYTTLKEHMASSHQFVSDWTPDRFKTWAGSIHADLELYITRILEGKQHPEQAYKSCVGILSYAKKVGNDRLIKACQRALNYELYNYKIIEKILTKGLDQITDAEADDQLKMPQHENIRGKNYYR